ncbi:MAG TPA: ATP-binding domain-containing protein [Solirubrobacteraceae bacterium]|nr:ATP-binding domain-containing protein [Solirubrobacteraceae bacterium]
MLLLDAAAGLGREFDAILVDEAQDFRADWITTLQLLLHDEDDGVLFLFADENQAIYHTDFAIPPGFLRYRLTGNLRNTAAIHGLLARHFAERSNAKGPPGIDVTIRCYRDDRQLPHELSSLLTALTDHGIKPAQITVLTGHSTDTSALARYQHEPLGSFRLCRSPSRHNDVRFESVHRFKGLEAPVVILCEMQHLHHTARKRVWYTGISRANSGLVLLLADSDGTLHGCDADTALAAVLGH